MARTGTPRIERMLARRRKELKAVFTDITKTIDDYTNASPLVFTEGCEGAPGQYIFKEEYDQKNLNKFHPWIERWMGVLYPRTLEIQRQANAGSAGDDEYMELCYDTNRFGFLIGYLMGCRSMGGSREQLMEKAAGFTVNDVGWRQWRAESEQKRKKRKPTTQPQDKLRQELLDLLEGMTTAQRQEIVKRVVRAIKRTATKSTRFDQPRLTLVGKE